MLLLFKLSHFDATKGEWLKAEGELNPVQKTMLVAATSFVFFTPLRRCATPPLKEWRSFLLLLSKLSHFDATKGEWLKAEGELILV